MNADATTAKLSILVPAATKRRLEAEAQAKKTTVGDLVRRRIDGDGEEQLFMDALAALGRRAMAVTAELDATRAGFEHAAATWAERDAEIRRATLAELSDRDRAGVAALFTTAPATPRGSAQS